MASIQPDDELIKGLDGDTDALSESEMEERRAKFEKRVKQNIAILLQPKKFDANKRAAAATWLGESGEPEAIQHLVKIYQRPAEDPKVKDAAERALSLFKALGEALVDPEMQDETLNLLEGIVYHGRMAKPARWGGGRLRRLNIGLIISALLLFVVGTVFSTPAGTGGEPATNTTPTSEATAPTNALDPQASIDAFREAYLAQDEQLRQVSYQIQLLARGQVGECSQSFEALPELTVDVEFVASDGRFAFFPQAYEGYQQVREVLNRAREALTQYCQTQTPIEAGALAGELLNAQATLARLEPIFGALGITLPPTPTPIPLPTETLTPTPTPAPTATLDAVLLRQQTLAVEQILNSMTGPRGLNEVLLVYWQDALNLGSDAGCRQYPALPLFPAAAQIPANVQALVPPELIASAEAANLGLSLSQQSWAGFISACNSGGLREVATIQIQAAQEAQRAFENAQALLNRIER